MIYITHEKSIGRSGHQFKDAITPLIISEIFGFTFVPTIYSSIEVFNLAEGRLRRTDLPPDIPIHAINGPHWKGATYDTVVNDFSHLHDQYKNRDCLVILKNSYRVQLFQTHAWYRDGLLKANIYERVVNSLRKNFSARNPDTSAGRDKILIVIHVRRGDVAEHKGRKPSSQHYAHSMEYYDAIISDLKQHLLRRSHAIEILTEFSNVEDVIDYCSKRPGILLRQGGKAEFGDHFSRMVYSDILVVSNSSMSQMAGYLSKGLKIFHPNDQYQNLPAEEFIPFNEIQGDRLKKVLID